jgi:hypothetical protein
MMNTVFAVRSVSAIACTFLLAGIDPAAVEQQKKPSITIRANPAAGFSPLRVVFTAELKGGSDDFKEFYCPTIEWDWGDDTRAESTADCEPYEEGKSEIRRRSTVTRVFETAGNFKVAFRLKQKDKVVGSSSTTVQVRPGLRDICCDDQVH